MLAKVQKKKVEIGRKQDIKEINSLTKGGSCTVRYTEESILGEASYKQDPDLAAHKVTRCWLPRGQRWWDPPVPLADLPPLHAFLYDHKYSHFHPLLSSSLPNSFLTPLLSFSTFYFAPLYIIFWFQPLLSNLISAGRQLMSSSLVPSPGTRVPPKLLGAGTFPELSSPSCEGDLFCESSNGVAPPWRQAAPLPSSP